MMREKESGRPSGTGTTAKRSDFVSHKYSTTNKNKLQEAIIAFFAVVLICATAWVLVDVFTNDVEYTPIQHKVTYGDTLWTIAEQYKPDGMTMDRYMAWVYEHNDGGMIYPGDVVIMAEVVK